MLNYFKKMVEKVETTQENKTKLDNIEANINEINQKVEINYPTLWKYKVIGFDEIKVKDCIITILKKREHKITHSRNSKGGKYKSLALEVMVHCEEDRVEIYEAIRTHDDVKMVL
jgi:putative lipoic acid-binding regulatory protein